MKGSKPGETFEIVYEETEDGSTGFKVIEPEGYRLRVTDGGMIPVKEDSIPTSFSAQRGKFYRFEVFSRGGLVFDKKFEAKPGMMGTLSVTVSGAPAVVAVVDAQPAPAAPSCMDDGDLSAISAEIERADFSEEKVGILEEAMKHRSICGAAGHQGARPLQLLGRQARCAQADGAEDLRTPRTTSRSTAPSRSRATRIRRRRSSRGSS